MQTVVKLLNQVNYQTTDNYMLYKIISFILCFTLSSFCYSQKADSINIVKAEGGLRKYFEGKIEIRDCLLYGIDNKYIFIRTSENSFKMFYVSELNGIEDSISFKKRHKILRRAFNPETCQNKFVYTSSDTIYSYQHPHSRFIYFMLKKDNQKVCEFCLPAMFSIDVQKKVIYPLDDKVQAFLIRKYFAHWK